MRKFTLEGFSAHLMKMAGAAPMVMHEALKDAAPNVVKEAKDEIGAYQRENMGPFPGWKELAEATKEDRVSKGFPENEPLLRTGDMRDSIESHVEGLKLHVGSDSKIALYQEMGTPDARHPIPPRPFLSVAVYRKREAVAKSVNIEVMSLIAGKGHIKRAIKDGN